MGSWLTLALEAITALPTIESGLAHLFQVVENEIVHGTGTTSPVAVARDLIDAADDIATALAANLASDTPAKGKPAPAE